MRDHILKNSVDLFRRHGYSKTTLTDIAKSVGKVKSAIYYYFGGKEEIFASIVKMEAKEFYLTLEKNIFRYQSPSDQIEVYVEQRIQLMQKIANRYSFLKKELFELLPQLEANRKVYLEEEIRLVAKILMSYHKIDHVQVEEDEVAFKASLLVNTLKGMEIQMYVTDEVAVIPEKIDVFKSFLLHGVLNK